MSYLVGAFCQGRFVLGALIDLQSCMFMEKVAEK